MGPAGTCVPRCRGPAGPPKAGKRRVNCATLALGPLLLGHWRSFSGICAALDRLPQLEIGFELGSFFCGRMGELRREWANLGGKPWDCKDLRGIGGDTVGENQSGARGGFRGDFLTEVAQAGRGGRSV